MTDTEQAKVERVAPLDAAIRIMLDAHRGQADKGGSPYFLHPLRVMLNCSGETAQIAAVLHDTVEDSALTLGEINSLFGEEIAEAVDALTRRNNENYVTFIDRCSANEIARAVKLADLADNMDLSRLNRNPTCADCKRQDKYAKARAAMETDDGSE